MLRTVNRLGRRARRGELFGQSFASVFDKLGAGGGAKLPETCVGHMANILRHGFHCPQPTIFAACLRPKPVGRRGVPGRHMNAVGHVADRHLVRRPARKQRRKKLPAHLPVQAADAIHPAASTNCQIGHIEILCRVVRVLAAESQQIVQRNAELRPSVTTQGVFDKGGGKPVKARGHRGVGGEEIACASHSQCDFEGLSGRSHKTPRTFQHGERRMPLIQVTDFRLDAERGKQSPSADSQYQLLHEAQIRSAAVKLAGNSPVWRKVRRIVAVQQVELQSADLNLPGAKPDRVTWQVEL